MNLDLNKFMQVAIDHAKLATKTHPNPKVGALFVDEQNNIFKANHQEYGKEHAEINLINILKKNKVSPKSGTLFVTLEPCAHHGKTPPCVEALIKFGFTKVIIGSQDPNPLTNGKSIQLLKENSIDVTSNILEQECFQLNRNWMITQEQSYSYIILKMAVSKNFKWTNDNATDRFITNEQSRITGNQLRSAADGVLTTFKSVQQDNAKMTARNNLNELNNIQPKLFLASKNIHELKNLNINNYPEKVTQIKIDDFNLFFKECLAKKLINILVEAGPSFSEKIFNTGLVNEIQLFQSKDFIKSGKSCYNFDLERINKNFNCVQTKKINTDENLVFFNKKNL